MPSNNVSVIAINRDVSAVAAVNLSVQETGVRVRAIPTPGGTVVNLPAKPFPNDGDCYEVIDGDGSCSPANLLTVVPPAGTTIRGLGVFVMSTPFASAWFTFDAAADSWIVTFSAGGASPTIADELWIDVAAGTTLAPTLAQQFLSCDTSGAQTTINLPAAAAAINGQMQLVKLTGNMLSPIVINAGAGTTIELANAPGTFGASTWLPIQGSSVFLKYDKATTQWKTWCSYEGSGAPGTVAFNPGWYARAVVAVDHGNVSGVAKDSNAGTQALPLRTYAEAVRRWGVFSPVLSAAVVVGATFELLFLSSHTDGTDPVIFDPIILGALTWSVQGAAPASVAAVFTRSSAKNRAAGTNAFLAGSFSAGAPAVGKMVQNTTGGKSSRAWIYKSAGGANWTLTQPLALGAVGVSPPQAEVDTWNSTDTVNVLTPIQVNILRIGPIVVDGSAQAGTIYQLTGFDPGGANTNQWVLSGNVQAIECSFQRQTLYSDAGNAGLQFVSNCLTLGQQTSDTGAPARLAGAGANQGFNSSEFNSAFFFLDGDYILGEFTVVACLQGIFGLVALDNGVFIESGVISQESLLYGSTVIYGSGANTINVIGSSRFTMGSGGTYVAAFTAPGLVTGIQLNGTASGNSAAYAANVATIHNGITTTPTHLDASPAGAAAFAGTAFNLGGASVSNVA